MRFLCLHGHGTNSQILEAQLEPLRANLPSDWEFLFLDGEMETPPAPGIDVIFPGPYLCYHEEPIPDEVKAAYDLVMEVVRDEGPFDAVLGFSQGAALAAAVVLNEAMKPSLADPFKMAVFLSSTMPFDLRGGKLHLTYDGINSLTAVHQNDNGDNLEEIGVDWMADSRSAGVIDEFEARRPKSQRPKQPQSIDVLLRYNPSTHSQRIRIPTAHVIGVQDDYADHGRSLAGMCEPRLTHIVTHDGGHQLPRATTTVAKVAQAIQHAVEQMRYQA